MLPELELARGEYYWHEVMGVTVRGVDGTDLGTVHDIYRVGENEVFSVEGGPFGSFDLPAVRAFIRVFAPRRGEIVVDAESLDLRPPRVRTLDPDRPRAPRRRTRGGRRPRRSGGSGATPDRVAGTAETARRPITGRRSRHPAARAMTLEIDILTLFPGDARRAVERSIPGRIQEQGLASIRVRDLREWGLGRHRWVDDAPYGGGAGMVLRPEPVAAALDEVRRPDRRRSCSIPAGEVFRQERAADLAGRTALDLRVPAL